MGQTVRKEWIDICKGIGAILVVLGHIKYTPDVLKIWIYSFHMPLFFFLAGYTYNEDKYHNLTHLLKNKVRTLLIPYFIYYSVYLLLNIMMNISSGINWGGVLRNVIGLILNIRGTEYGLGIWFIPCIFVSFIFMWMILRVCKENKQIMIVGFAIFGGGILYSKIFEVTLPWAIDASLVATPIMILGYLCARNNYFIKKLFVSAFGGLIVNILLTFINYKISGVRVDMWGNQYGVAVLFVFESITGIISLISFAKLLENTKGKILQNIGKKSLYIYGIHSSILVLLNQVYFVEVNQIVAIMFTVAELVIIFGVLLLLEKYIHILEKRLETIIIR